LTPSDIEERACLLIPLTTVTTHAAVYTVARGDQLVDSNSVNTPTVCLGTLGLPLYWLLSKAGSKHICFLFDTIHDNFNEV